MFTHIFNFLFIIFLSTSLFGECFPNEFNRKIKIGILRHINIEQAQKLSIDSNAERLIVDAACSRGYEIEFINPLNVISTNDSAHYDAIISRVEVDSFASNLTDAYLRTLDYFKTLGIPIINSSLATINAQDKFRTLLLAKKVGVQVPLTFMAYSLEDVQSILKSEKISFPFFVKKPYSGCGQGVFLVTSNDELLKIITQNFKALEPILVEENVDLETDENGNVKDMRIWVVRDHLTNKAKFLGGAYRTAAKGNYLTNISAGGSISSLEKPYDTNIIKIAEMALESIGADVFHFEDNARNYRNKYMGKCNGACGKTY